MRSRFIGGSPCASSALSAVDGQLALANHKQADGHGKSGPDQAKFEQSLSDGGPRNEPALNKVLGGPIRAKAAEHEHDDARDGCGGLLENPEQDKVDVGPIHALGF